MKILILLAYYNRPNMVKFALETVKNQNYKNWELVFIDDSSPIPGEPIVKEIMADCLDKVKIINTNDKEKAFRGESIFGKFWNDAVLESDADIAIMLCDDDGLYQGYLEVLANWYKNNPQENYSYSHVVAFNPFDEKRLGYLNVELNNQTDRINPYNRVDASQVSWRTDAFKKYGVRFPFPQTRALDATLYAQLYQLYGACPFNNTIAQYKAFHADQLGQRSFANNFSIIDIKGE